MEDSPKESVESTSEPRPSSSANVDQEEYASEESKYSLSDPIYATAKTPFQKMEIAHGNFVRALSSYSSALEELSEAQRKFHYFSLKSYLNNLKKYMQTEKELQSSSYTNLRVVDNYLSETIPFRKLEIEFRNSSLQFRKVLQEYHVAEDKYCIAQRTYYEASAAFYSMPPQNDLD